MPLEEQQPAATPEPVEPPSLDINDAVAQIAESLHLSDAEPEKETPAAEPAEAKPEGEAAATDPATGTVAEPTETGLQAPDTWTKEAKEAWATVPPRVQQEIRKREEDVARYVGETQYAVWVSKGFEKVMAPYQELYQKHNVDPYQQVAGLLEAHAKMFLGGPRERAEMLAAIARDFQVDLKALAEGQVAVLPQSESDTQIRALRQELQNLKSGVTSVTSTVQEARLNELTASVEQYAADTENHPYFQQVAPQILHFINTKAARSLDEAYQLAIMADPRTRDLVIKAEADKRAAQVASAANARAAKAAKAVSGNVRSSGTGRAAPPVGDIDSTLRDVLADIKSR